MDDNLTGIRPPYLGPIPPGYPPLRQLMRVTGPSVGGVAPALLEQWDDKNLVLRDREPAFAWEPNLLSFPKGVFQGRLISTWQGKPLFVVSLACCGGIPASSSSPSVASPSVPSSSFPSSRLPSSSGIPSPSSPSSPKPSLSSQPSVSLPSTSPPPTSSVQPPPVSSAAPSASPSSSSSSSSSGSSSSSSSSGIAGTISTTCCPNLLPTTLYATFSGFLSGTVPIQWAGGQTWTASTTLCGFTSSVQLVCSGSVWTLQISAGGGSSCFVPTTSAQAGGMCLPFMQTFNMTGLSGCCAGQNFTVVVTE